MDSHGQGISLSLFFFLFLKCGYLNIYTPACPTLMPLIQWRRGSWAPGLALLPARPGKRQMPGRRSWAG